MDLRTRIIGLVWPLLDLHGDRDADDLPETYRGDMRALYAASETYLQAEVAATEARRQCRWNASATVALMRLAWTAGLIAGEARVRSGRRAKAPPTPSDLEP